MAVGRPGPDEYGAFYAGYVAGVGDVDIVSTLADQAKELGGLLDRLGPGGAAHRYAAGKWSIAEVVGHLADAERIFGMRATCVARGETAPLPGFDENAYVAEGRFDLRTIDNLRREFELLRAANATMFGALSEDRWRRRGTASGSPITVRALAWIIVGHLDHHLEVLRDRYGEAFSD
ncbi:MAG: DinB family protein [Gemmatimonadota bacterium]